MGIKMVSVFMISRRRLATVVLIPAALFLIDTACNRVPLLAPSGSNITLTDAQPNNYSDPTVDTQLTNLKASGADTLLLATVPKPAAQRLGIRYGSEVKARPPTGAALRRACGARGTGRTRASGCTRSARIR